MQKTCVIPNNHNKCTDNPMSLFINWFHRRESTTISLVITGCVCDSKAVIIIVSVNQGRQRNDTVILFRNTIYSNLDDDVIHVTTAYDISVGEWILTELVGDGCVCLSFLIYITLLMIIVHYQIDTQIDCKPILTAKLWSLLNRRPALPYKFIP